MDKPKKTLSESLRELNEAYNQLIIEIAKALWIDKLCDWMNEKLRRFYNG